MRKFRTLLPFAAAPFRGFRTGAPFLQDSNLRPFEVSSELYSTELTCSPLSIVLACRGRVARDDTLPAGLVVVSQ